MDAGPELDALVGDKVMKMPPSSFLIRSIDEYTGIQSTISRVSYPHYSTDISEAQFVLEKMQGLPYLTISPKVNSSLGVWDQWQIGIGDHHFVGKTLPHVICLAALAFLAESIPKSIECIHEWEPSYMDAISYTAEGKYCTKCKDFSPKC